MPDQIKKILQIYKKELHTLPDSSIKKIILYGSYARGDFNKNSDIDIMILVDQKNFKKCEDQIFDLTYDFNQEHNTDIMPIVQNIGHFNYWKKAYMFYRNITQEGVEI
ncbi:MAG TPA: DNA polymerase subunit beta [Lachnospiraceae bacterium]|nr:DNA polymerase subunit beta [Lachnospiraceae bacterium]